MRLICPNCDAQYEVPLDVIPTAGRDVQCSNCGHTWYQYHPDHMPEAIPADLELEASEVAPDPAPVTEPEPEPVAPTPPPAPQPRKPVPAPPVAPARRALDPEVADVLREEAEREARVRAAERDRLESQPDLGLDEPKSKPRRPAPPPPVEDEPEDLDPPAVPEPPKGASRRDLLPDIEEINSTLRTATEQREIERDQEAQAELAEPQSGFGKGLRAAVLLFLIGFAVYVFAPHIVDAVPQAEPFLTSYTSAIDGARIWLETQFQGALGALDGMSSESSGS
ncbi:zinc-ribbon domain-containing protein [Pseudoprimorskyibacter insulae]|uniref:Zinc finger/thioredoxin putative domain-containing protein n=1 Tax=Pseudoprimorskyibacter insulae TaxID=1695997 RepID=A0A2R8AP13_9RHOB|nr:zinc-ribbon domain-containing protein [Pseudoprimorskyibacter insulae]SPF77808.1 hypothetical protein PRI8871_00394 [Pseudoprimorskyibacter insulae]